MRAGLEALGPCEWVVVHDGARPLVTRELIDKGLAAARETGAATCAVPLHDSIKLVNDKGLVEKSLDRRRLWQVQTPQVFRYDLLMEAHRAAAKQPPASDDAALVERLGYPVKVFMGSYHNIKVTTPDDLVLAQILLSGTVADMRIGIGYDVHPFGKGRRLMFGGVRIEGEQGLTATATPTSSSTPSSTRCWGRRASATSASTSRRTTPPTRASTARSCCGT